MTKEGYEAIAIPEYWLVDPQTREVLILELVSGVYQQAGLFSEEQVVVSPQFKELGFRVNELWAQDEE